MCFALDALNTDISLNMNGRDTCDIPNNSSFPFLFSSINITVCYKNGHRNMALNSTFQIIHIIFLNSDFSVNTALNLTRLSLLSFRGKRVSEFVSRSWLICYAM